jgi:hypothetical protein
MTEGPRQGIAELAIGFYRHDDGKQDVVGRSFKGRDINERQTLSVSPPSISQAERKSAKPVSEEPQAPMPMRSVATMGCQSWTGAIPISMEFAASASAGCAPPSKLQQGRGEGNGRSKTRRGEAASGMLWKRSAPAACGPRSDGMSEQTDRRTDEQIVQTANSLARDFYAFMGYEVPEGYRFDQAGHLGAHRPRHR